MGFTGHTIRGRALAAFLVGLTTLGAWTPNLQAREWTRSTLSWPPRATTRGWSGWWFRGRTEWLQFTFSGIDTNLINNYVTVEFHLRVTNGPNGHAGLDGLVDVVINPELTPTKTYTDVLLDNVDPHNRVYSLGTGGSYSTIGSIEVAKDYIVGGQLVIRVLRHPSRGRRPAAPVGTEQSIDMSTTPPTVPARVYHGDDAHTVHIGVKCQDGAGGHIVDGQVVVLSAEGKPNNDLAGGKIVDREVVVSAEGKPRDDLAGGHIVDRKVVVSAKDKPRDDLAGGHIVDREVVVPAEGKPSDDPEASKPPLWALAILGLLLAIILGFLVVVGAAIVIGRRRSGPTAA